MIKLILQLIPILFIISCTSEVDEAISVEKQELNSVKNEECLKGECPCETPRGNLAHGAKITVYEESEVPCDGDCRPLAEAYRCHDGHVIPEGLAVDLINPEKNYLEGKSYTCTAIKCQSCRFGKNVVPHNGSVTLYSSEEVDCELSCEDFKQVRRCKNGTLEGDASFDKVSCRPKECRCELPDGTGHISLGGKINMYLIEDASCTTTCEDNYKAERTCVSSGSGDSRTFSLSGSSSYKYQSCEDAKEEDCFCNLPGYGGVVEGAAPILLFSKSVLYCGEHEDQYKASFHCNGGELFRNNLPFDPASEPGKRYYQNISDLCRRCRTPWGAYIDVGEKVNAFKVVGAGSGTCGKGCKKQVRECVADHPQSTLTSGFLTGDPSYDSQQCENLCFEEGGGAPPRACLLPWQNTYVSPGAKIPMWKKNTVPCGQSCQDHFKLGTCNIDTGAFNVGPEYIHKSCTELCL